MNGLKSTGNSPETAPGAAPLPSLSRKLRIAVDWDGTLANTHELVLELMNFKFDTKFTTADWNTWEFWDEQGKSQAFWEVFDIMDRTHLRRAIRPTSPFACSAIKYLQQRGHTVELVTSNSEIAAKDIAAWLFGHGLDIPVRAVERGSAHQKIQLDYDVFIDDAPSLAEEFIKDAGQKWLILYDQQWNRIIRDGTNSHIMRMRDWRYAVESVELTMWLS